MAMNKESAVERAKQDLANRLQISVDDISEKRVLETEFPDMSLGAPAVGEMSAQMISNGWTIELDASGKSYDYRADKYQMRLHNFNGENHVLD